MSETKLRTHACASNNFNSVISAASSLLLLCILEAAVVLDG